MRGTDARGGGRVPRAARCVRARCGWDRSCGWVGGVGATRQCVVATFVVLRLGFLLHAPTHAALRSAFGFPNGTLTGSQSASYSMVNLPSSRACSPPLRLGPVGALLRLHVRKLEVAGNARAAVPCHQAWSLNSGASTGLTGLAHLAELDACEVVDVQQQKGAGHEGGAQGDDAEGLGCLGVVGAGARPREAARKHGDGARDKGGLVKHDVVGSIERNQVHPRRHPRRFSGIPLGALGRSNSAPLPARRFLRADGDGAVVGLVLPFLVDLRHRQRVNLERVFRARDPKTGEYCAEEKSLPAEP